MIQSVKNILFNAANTTGKDKEIESLPDYHFFDTPKSTPFIDDTKDHF